jgi:hypothetical protein
MDTISTVSVKYPPKRKERFSPLGEVVGGSRNPYFERRTHKQLADAFRESGLP